MFPEPRVQLTIGYTQLGPGDGVFGEELQDPVHEAQV